MSNQVYSNETRKFYALPGMNLYVMSSDLALAGSSGDAPNTVPTSITFQFVDTGNSVVNDPSIIDLVPGGFLVVKEGIYSIKLEYGLINAVDPTTGDVDYNILARLTRTGTPLNGVILDQVQHRIVSPGSTTHGSTYRHDSLSYVGYMRAGDEVTFEVENYEAQGLVVTSNSVQLLINKIY